MPEVQKPVLEHAAPKANQNQGLASRLASESEWPAALMQIRDEPCSDVSARSEELKILLPYLTIMNQVALQVLRSVGLEEVPPLESVYESASGLDPGHAEFAGD